MTPPDPPRRRGRPPVDPDDPSVDVHLMLPSKAYDRAYAIASGQGLTVPEVLRRALRLPPPPDNPER